MRVALNLVGDLSMALSLLVAVEWVIAYHRLTRGAWRRSPMGRHLMTFMAVLGAGFAVITAHWALIQLPQGGDPLAPTWFLAIRAAVFAAILAVMVWRRLMLRQAQLERIRSDRTGGTAG